MLDRLWNNLVARATLFAHRTCKVLGVSVYYDNGKGIKVLNRRQLTSASGIVKEIELPPAQLHLCYDGLRDDYTSAGKAVTESPHYSLMVAISRQENLFATDYVVRENSGTLDGRFSLVVNADTLENHRHMWKQSSHELKEKKYKRPIVCKGKDGKYYILDGKHHAAMAALMGVTIICNEIETTSPLHGYAFHLYKKMLKRKHLYTTNLNVLDSLTK